jgi:4-hydroxythreonine-4-phosphate dehydrogenase
VLNPNTSRPITSQRIMEVMQRQIAPSNPNRQRLVIALGDPAGIGAEVTLKALANAAPETEAPLLVGCRRWLEQRYCELRRLADGPLRDPAELELVDLPLAEPIQAGHGTPASGDASFQWLTAASQAVGQGWCHALVTAPISKTCWHAAGHRYPGQTERLAELSGVAEASMLFTARSPQGHWRLNTLLATTHIPLAAVPERLNGELVHRKLAVLLEFCRRFSSTPRLVVAGLNPHAGEAGQLGREEAEWLEQCLDGWRRAHPEVELTGPVPADSCWLGAAETWRGGAGGADGYLALYHDQGLIPVKLLAFDAAVNTTLGLPFLRTSPDHGTGFGIAGLGIARATSMAAALETAWNLG